MHMPNLVEEVACVTQCASACHLETKRPRTLTICHRDWLYNSMTAWQPAWLPCSRWLLLEIIWFFGFYESMTEGLTEGQTYRLPNWPTDGLMDRRADEPRDGRTDSPRTNLRAVTFDEEKEVISSMKRFRQVRVGKLGEELFRLPRLLPKTKNEQTNEPTNKRTNEKTNKWKNERTNKRTNERMNEQMNGWMNKWTNEWTDFAAY